MIFNFMNQIGSAMDTETNAFADCGAGMLWTINQRFLLFITSSIQFRCGAGETCPYGNFASIAEELQYVGNHKSLIHRR